MGAQSASVSTLRDERLTAGILIEPVARVRSPFEEKFGIPRQAGLVSAIGEVVMLPPFDDPAMFDGLDGFSHVWLLFQFHQCADQGWRPQVRPPRLGGNREVGVWASRAPYRPNHLGLSAVSLLDVVISPRPLLRVSGLDLVDGTPVFDIKPYLPYADAIPAASGGFASAAPRASQVVRFGARAEAELARLPDAEGLRRFVVATLELDPRPAYRQGPEPGRTYGTRLAGVDVRWRVDASGIEVVDVVAARELP